MIEKKKKRVKRISSTFNNQQIYYLQQLSRMEGIPLTTYVTDLAVQAIREAVKTGRIPVNLPSLEERHRIMCKFIVYFYLAEHSDDIPASDIPTEHDLEFVSDSIGITTNDLKKTFFN
jgi:hypothetical protein